MEKFVIFFILNKSIIAHLFPNLKLKVVKIFECDSSSLLKSSIIIVDIIMKLDCQHNRGKKDAMYIIPVEAKVSAAHVISINVDDSNNKALRGKRSIFMNAIKIIAKTDLRYFFRVKYRYTWFPFTFN